MFSYRLAGQNFHFPFPVPELVSYEIPGTNPGMAEKAVPFVPPSFLGNESTLAASQELISLIEGWVANAQRSVEVWSVPSGFLMRVSGGNDFYISADGQVSEPVSREQGNEMMDETDRQILLGPVIVLALALRRVWCLHASAVMFNDKVIIFLGESGQGKSTLSSYLSQSAGWRLVSDDILPVRMNGNNLQALPHFPQLKISVDSQPALGLPEYLPLTNICLLKDTEVNQAPELQTLTTARGLQALLAHTAGARMFNADLLARHLEFCAEAAPHIAFHSLLYPHRMDALPVIREMLETRK